MVVVFGIVMVSISVVIALTVIVTTLLLINEAPLGSITYLQELKL